MKVLALDMNSIGKNWQTFSKTAYKRENNYGDACSTSTWVSMMFRCPHSFNHILLFYICHRVQKHTVIISLPAFVTKCLDSACELFLLCSVSPHSKSDVLKYPITVRCIKVFKADSGTPALSFQTRT